MGAEVVWTEDVPGCWTATAHGCRLVVGWHPEEDEWGELVDRWEWTARLGVLRERLGGVAGAPDDTAAMGRAQAQAVAAARTMAHCSGLAAALTRVEALEAVLRELVERPLYDEQGRCNVCGLECTWRPRAQTGSHGDGCAWERGRRLLGSEREEG